jgi:AraC family transcriptional regulator
MRLREPKTSDELTPLELIKRLPEAALATSDRRQWAGLQAVRYRNQPANENFVPALSHHMFLLFLGSPKELDVKSEGLSRTVPPPAGSIIMVPAGQPARYRWNGYSDSLHVFLKPELIEHIAEESFDLDPARVSAVPPLDGLHHPQLRSVMLAVNDELVAGADGDHLAAESLANLLAVHLIRHLSPPRATSQPAAARRADAPLPPAALRAVIGLIEEHLRAGLTLEQMASTACLSTYHFARQFKAATGVSPHQYVIARRVECAKQLLQQRRGDLSLAEVATRAGFSDQSHFTNRFRRLVGITPSQFRASAGTS